eukprot:359519-Chlamydomonas_euryale.AAC.4
MRLIPALRHLPCFKSRFLDTCLATRLPNALPQPAVDISGVQLPRHWARFLPAAHPLSSGPQPPHCPMRALPPPCPSPWSTAWKVVPLTKTQSVRSTGLSTMAACRGRGRPREAVAGASVSVCAVSAVAAAAPAERRRAVLFFGSRGARLARRRGGGGSERSPWGDAHARSPGAGWSGRRRTARARGRGYGAPGGYSDGNGARGREGGTGRVAVQRGKASGGAAARGWSCGAHLACRGPGLMGAHARAACWLRFGRLFVRTLTPEPGPSNNRAISDAHQPRVGGKASSPRRHAVHLHLWPNPRAP